MIIDHATSIFLRQHRHKGLFEACCDARDVQWGSAESSFHYWTSNCNCVLCVRSTSCSELCQHNRKQLVQWNTLVRPHLVRIQENIFLWFGVGAMFLTAILACLVFTPITMARSKHRQVMAIERCKKHTRNPPVKKNSDSFLKIPAVKAIGYPLTDGFYGCGSWYLPNVTPTWVFEIRN